MAVDVGKVRIGLAVSDFHGILATPLGNLPRLADITDTIASLLELVEENSPVEIYVGLPLSMQAKHTASTQDALAFSLALQAKTAIPIRFIDERLTSVSANAILKGAGKDGRESRKLVDQVAATLILEQALDLERAGSECPGISVLEYVNE
jgi:putative Holliday junction resolvase